MSLQTAAPAVDRDAPAQSPSGTTVSRWQAGLLAAVMILVVVTTVALTSDDPGPTWALLIGGVLALCLAFVAVSSFQTFVLIVLLVRPALDWPKSVGLDPNGLLNVGAAGLLVVASVLWLAAQGRNGTRRPVSRLSVALLAMLGALALATALSQGRAVSLESFLKTATAVVAFLVLEQLLRTRRQVELVLAAVLGSAVFPLVIGAYQALSGNYSRSADGLGRISGTLVHPNSFGFFLVIIITLAVAVLPHVRTGQRWLLSMLVVACGVELLLTYSRGGWVTLLLALLVIGILQSRVLLLAIPVAVGAVLLLLPNVAVRFTDLEQAESATGTAGNSLLWRFDQWESSLALADGRFWTGIGPGMSDVFLSLPPHNDGVRMYTEAGIIGLVTYLVVLVALLVLAVRCVRSAPAGLPRGVAVGAAGISLAFVIDSSAANLISQIVILIYVFTVAAAAQALALPRPDADPTLPEEDPWTSSRALTENAAGTENAAPAGSSR